ncbi:hypothetical protein ACE7GA_10910 [Roseomonas sp. CCTCC AB2023176]|uniref:hypothetical protein n=1 Tax=Roseomonas sp. CCTCC AB2023176 TaxID=3342640 RepID=UPI0035E3527A
MKVLMIPSAGGGLGHISRCASLARAVRRLDPRADVEFVFDTDRMRPFNVQAAAAMGFPPRLMPPRPRPVRDAVIAEVLGDADVIVDDSTRYLITHRARLPRAGWVSVPMHPIGDEIFLDWPFMRQMDAVIWAYAPLVGLLPELDLVRDRLVVTGPFLDFGEVPGRDAARAALGLGGPTVLYAPRGFPFGAEWGHAALAATVAGVAAARAAHPALSLHLTAVTDPSALRGVPGLPDPLPGWITVHGMLPAKEALLRLSAAAAVVGEGTSTMHEAAALGTPLLLRPGPIEETRRLGEALVREGAGFDAAGGAEAMTRALRAVLDDPGEAARRALRPARWCARAAGWTRRRGWCWTSGRGGARRRVSSPVALATMP